eukprot:jgi/Hompol1/4849/HPOL_001649-RA
MIPSSSSQESLPAYHPPEFLREHVHSLAIVKHTFSQTDFKAAPFHPLLVSTTEPNDNENDGELDLMPLMKGLEDVEGTLLRGKLLFRHGGIEYGIGRISKETRSLVMFLHLGDSICGHK